jgi:hypothetical protein
MLHPVLHLRFARAAATVVAPTTAANTAAKCSKAPRARIPGGLHLNCSVGSRLSPPSSRTRAAPGSPPLPTAGRSAACDGGRAPRWTQTRGGLLRDDFRARRPQHLGTTCERRRNRATRRRSGRRRARGCLLQEVAAAPLLAVTACNGGHLPGDGLQRRPVTNGADPGAGGLVRPRSSEALGGAGIRDSRPGGARFAPADLAGILLDSRPRRPPPSSRGRDRPPPPLARIRRDLRSIPTPAGRREHNCLVSCAKGTGKLLESLLLCSAGVCSLLPHNAYVARESTGDSLNRGVRLLPDSSRANQLGCQQN